MVELWLRIVQLCLTSGPERHSAIVCGFPHNEFAHSCFKPLCTDSIHCCTIGELYGCSHLPKLFQA